MESRELRLGDKWQPPEQRTGILRPKITLKPSRDGEAETLKVKLSWRRSAVRKLTEIGHVEYTLWVR